ncbi:PD-(D/E)XK nuclease family protein [Chloroflexota bacterium]
MNFKLSPSDLTFAYSGCKRCFYLKVVKGIPQPSIPIPSIFSKIAGLLKTHYTGKHSSELHLNLPPGTISYGEKGVRSQIIELPNHDDTCYLSGRFDIVISFSFEDGTYGVIDFKTGSPSESSANMYSRQLHAYAYALEHAAPSALSLYPITKMGLVYFYPSSVTQQNIEKLSYDSDVVWIEIDKKEDKFLKFIDEVLTIVESPTVPPHSPSCQWCGYLRRMGSIYED